MKFEDEKKIIELESEVQKRLEQLERCLTPEVKLEIAQNMNPHIVCQDRHGHSKIYHIRVHPAFGIYLEQAFEKHSIKFRNKHDYIRYLLTIGYIIDRAYTDSVDEETANFMRLLREINRKMAEADLECQIKEIEQRLFELQKLGISRDTIDGVISIIKETTEKI